MRQKKDKKEMKEPTPEVPSHTQQASHSDEPSIQPESGAGPEVRENQMRGDIDRDPRDDI
jgi:hypothetical protein